MVVKDASGQDTRGAREADHGPETPEWFTKPVGQEPLIPPPWKPIDVAHGGKPKLSFLMGEYDLMGAIAPPPDIRVGSILRTSSATPILRAPVTLTGVVDGKPVELRGSPRSSASRTTDVVRVTLQPRRRQRGDRRNRRVRIRRDVRRSR